MTLQDLSKWQFWWWGIRDCCNNLWCHRSHVSWCWDDWLCFKMLNNWAATMVRRYFPAWHFCKGTYPPWHFPTICRLMTLPCSAHSPACIVRLVKVTLPCIVHFPVCMLRFVKMTLPRIVHFPWLALLAWSLLLLDFFAPFFQPLLTSLVRPLSAWLWQRLITFVENTWCSEAFFSLVVTTFDAPSEPFAPL